MTNNQRPLLMNRYPKRGKSFRWTVKELEAIGPAWKGDTLADGHGLQGDVRVNEVNVCVAWRYAYKWDGKAKRYYCGTWPTLSLEQVRANRDQAREWIKGGINPNDQKRAVGIDAQRKVEATIKIYEKIKVGKFPKYIKNGRSTRWLASEIDKWICKKIAKRSR